MPYQPSRDFRRTSVSVRNHFARCLQHAGFAVDDAPFRSHSIPNMTAPASTSPQEAPARDGWHCLRDRSPRTSESARWPREGAIAIPAPRSPRGQKKDTCYNSPGRHLIPTPLWHCKAHRLLTLGNILGENILICTIPNRRRGNCR
jgi:hypothetical protein